MNPLIQGLFNKFKESEELQGIGDDDAFELFSASLFLPDNLLAQAEKTDFLLDSGTIGIDVVALEINEQLVWDPSDVKELCDAAGKIDVTVHFIQAKRSPNIRSTDILGFGSTVQRFLRNESFPEFPRLREMTSALGVIFSDYATILKSPPSVYLYFVTSAPKAATEDSIVNQRADEARKNIHDLGFVGKSVINVFGTDDLHDAWIRKNHANEVEIQLEKQINLPKMPGVDQAILGVVSVSELLKLVHEIGRA